MLKIRCPHCGNYNRHRKSSFVVNCKYCKQQYELKPNNLAKPLFGLWLGAAILVLFLLCGGSTLFLLNIIEHTPNNKQIKSEPEPTKPKITPAQPKKENEPKEVKFIGNEKQAAELLTQAKFLKGTNQLDRCKEILNEILIKHTDTKTAKDAKDLLEKLK